MIAADSQFHLAYNKLQIITFSNIFPVSCQH